MVQIVICCFKKKNKTVVDQMFPLFVSLWSRTIAASGGWQTINQLCGIQQKFIIAHCWRLQNKVRYEEIHYPFETTEMLGIWLCQLGSGLPFLFFIWLMVDHSNIHFHSHLEKLSLFFPSFKATSYSEFVHLIRIKPLISFYLQRSTKVYLKEDHRPTAQWLKI